MKTLGDAQQAARRAEQHASLHRAIHDLHARLGSIRMAVTSVAGLDLDGETRSAMLTTASEESVRAAAELSAIGALTTCLLDHAADTGPPTDIADAVRDAVHAARLAGFEIDVSADGAATASVTGGHLRTVLPALFRLVSDAGSPIAVAVSAQDERVRIEVRRRRDDGEALPLVGSLLVEAVGGRLEQCEDGLAFSFASAR